jgi:hypothetical protein
VKDGQLLISGRVVAASTLTLAILAGFVASVAMVLAFAIAYAAALALGRLPVPILAGWFQGLTNNALIDTAGPNLYAATALFFLGGLIWALLYGLVFEPRLPGAAWQKGVRFALIPWVFSLAIVIPLVGGGILGLSLGAGPLPIIGNLILHAVYGAILGTVYGTAESVFDRPAHRAGSEDLLAGRLAELGAARGMGIGLALGIVLGVIGAALVPQFTGMQGGGSLNPLAMVVAVGLTGAAFGGFVGSLSAG